MIDWQVLIDGCIPPGWDEHNDGCCFPDFDYQEYLLPFFDVGDTLIDPYDATIFREADLRRLREHLESYRAYFEARPEEWSITETASDETKTIRLERARVLAILHKTLQMIEFALSHGGVLVFRGD